MTDVTIQSPTPASAPTISLSTLIVIGSTKNRTIAAGELITASPKAMPISMTSTWSSTGPASAPADRLQAPSAITVPAVAKATQTAEVASASSTPAANFAITIRSRRGTA